MEQDTEFVGAKLALFLGDALAVIMRDERLDIPWPGYLDLPGGGREGTETPRACAVRETQEELGLRIGEHELGWGQRFDRPQGGHVWFFAAHLPVMRGGDIKFGDEGQYWRLMMPQDYLRHPQAIPHFQDRLALYLSSRQAA